MGRNLQNNQFTGTIDVLANLPLDNLCVSVVSYDIAGISFPVFPKRKT